MAKRKTHEEFVQEIYEKYGDEYTVLSGYTLDRNKILIRHNCINCNNHKWSITPSSILQGHGCPICGGTKKKTHNEFVKEVKIKYGREYMILGKYINNNEKLLIKHNSKKCNNYEWGITPASLLSGVGCPVCANQKVVLGINTIWDTDRWMCDLGVSEEDAKKYTKGSGQRITVKCPDCGRKKNLTIHQVYITNSIGCVCEDGISYPEKFMISVLDHLGIEYKTQYSPKWINNKRYDFYVRSMNCIIETHGQQHYRKGFNTLGGRTLEEEQVNDKYKRKVALANGIEHYIELDCSESNMKYIKSSILNSKLTELFDLSKVDWLKCAEFANKNIVKEVCDYWNNKKEDEGTDDLGKKFRLNRNTVTRYLKTGVTLGWCKYNAVEMQKNKWVVAGWNNKEMVIVKNEINLGIFTSAMELERKSEKLFGIKLLHGSISEVCNNKKPHYKGFKFFYLDNLTEEEKEKYNIPQKLKDLEKNQAS